MAGIQHKTKNSNTFRFKSFGERVNDIDIRHLALYHIGHENEELPENDETYFHQTLRKWMALNLTEEYAQFSRKCIKIVTLPQLIHQKDFVVDLLLERLATATSLSLQPLLELLYVLARDLREEFYAYFQRVLDRLICLLHTQDAEQLEWTLVCLAYLFKALKPHLRKNIGVVFHAILPLLDEQNYEEHVTNFAVECFSFIARDVRDYRKFLDFVLDTVVHEQVESVQGCGRLLFEIMRGVQGQFHSVAGDFLQFIFEYLVDEKRRGKEKSQLLRDIVLRAVQDMLQFIQPQNMKLFWTKLCDVAAASTTNIKKISNLIELCLEAATYHNGRYLAEMDVVVPTILGIYDKCAKAQEDKPLPLLIQLVSVILMCNSKQVTQLDTTRLLRKTLALPQRELYEDFVSRIVEHTQFDILVLPAVIEYFELHFDERAFALLADIVLSKRPLALSAAGLEDWKPYSLQFKRKETLNKFEAKLKQSNFNDEEQDLLLLILAPHVNSLDKTFLQPILEHATLQLLERLNVAENLQRNLLIFSLLLETQLKLNFKPLPAILEQIVAALLPHVRNLRALGALDQILTHNLELIQESNTTQLTNALAPLLCAHDHAIRLTAAHCLQILHKQVVGNPYKICYAAECIQPDIHTCREQLLLLEKLQPEGEFFKSLTQEAYKLDILRYLLGVLYQNFKLIWEPVLKLIESYAHVLDRQQFWLIYREKMQETQQQIDYEQLNATQQQAEDNIWLLETLNKHLTTANAPALTQQQLLNYRNLLWMRLPRFGQIIEVYNKDLVSSFLEFVNAEYRQHLELQEFTWDLSVDSKHSMLLSADDDPDADDIDVDLLQKPKRKQKHAQHAIAKSILQTLQHKLAVFAVQPNPKALYREPELYNFYMDILAGPNTQLQKLALDCVLAYKAKALTTYKQHLYDLLDEQKFKDELVSFKLEEISADHRAHFMQILLRLLYGKMITKGTQRNISSQLRKSLILRFLAQCSSDEIFWFLQMAFGRYTKYTSADIDLAHIPTLVKEDFDLHAVWSARKLKSVVNLLDLIQKEFAGSMNAGFQLYMLKLLVFVGSVCNEVLQVATNEMQPKMSIVYKNVRTSALLSLVNFFAHFEDFEWQASQMNCLTAVYVWPTIAKLPHESIHTPTPLLKLLLQWGERPKLFTYLAQTYAEDDHNIFHYLMLLLLNEKAKLAVHKPILELIERLLVISDKKHELPELSAQALSLIKPFVMQILKRLKMNFSTRRARQNLDKRDLNILSLLTTQVEEPETCDSLLQLLLPVLISKSQSSTSEEVVCQVITTISNLIKRLDAPETYLRKVAPLFEQTQEVAARKLLCQLLTDIARKRHKDSKHSEEEVSPELVLRLTDIARLIHLLNAWDKRWVEQPDYDKRLNALKEVAKKLENNAVDMDLGVLVIYNCFYFLKYDKDIGLRDNASEHLKLLLPKLTQKFAGDKVQLNYLVGEVFINLIRRVIRDANENVRNEGIRLLGEMARQCPEAHEILSDLAPLGDKQDEEVDFFENLTHLQTHRHGRALLRFCSQAEKLTKTPSVRTLTQFVLPLASRYLLQEKYASKHTLVDAAIETVGVVCQLLPWSHYHSILRFYLTKMRSTYEHQKQCVRIVVRILDAFHFDLSQSKADEQTLVKLKKELIDNAVEGDLKIEENGEKTTAVEVDEGVATDEEAEVEKEDAEIEEDVAIEENAETEDEAETDAVAESAKTDQEQQQSMPILKQHMLLTPSASRRVLLTITTVLIPTLNRSITEKSSYDRKHKVNRKRFSIEREEEEILRVPIALALVKLMQKLPKELLETGLPGVFMKVCTFLRSPLKSVRMLTRDILKKIMLALGSSYLAMLMDHLQTLLTRGFQVHVLSVTVHGVLDALRAQLQPGDIESCLRNLLEVALNDIFGDISAEKEVAKIGARAPEAKPSAKSYLVLHIAARNIQETCLLDLLLPFKDYLTRSHSRKLTLKIQDCFAKIVAGLVENPYISRESLLIFIYGTMSESITDLLPGVKKVALSEKEKARMQRARPDCFLIQPEPRSRSGAVNKTVKSNAQANAHILIEFGLEMLHIVLKRKKLVEIDYQPFLNPILPLLKDALKSTHIRVTTFALKCLASIWNEAYDLPELQQYLHDIVERMFEILKNFSIFGATKQEDNLQLTKSVSKALVALLRKCTDFEFTPAQIDALVLHVEQDLYEGDNQHMSFSLLKAMVTRKVDNTEIHEIMRRLGELSITSYSDFVRDEARAILLTYLMEYKLKNRLDQIVKFFTVQLCYEVPTGRQSAIKLLHLIVKKFSISMLARRAEFLYLSLGQRLVNDDDPDCRKAVAECIELLIMRLGKTDRQRLFDVTLLFFDAANKPTVREMAAALCSRFLNAEKQSFAERLKVVLPTIVARLTLNNPRAPGRFVKAPGAVGFDVTEEIVRHKSKRHKGSQELVLSEAEIAAAIAEKQREIDHEIIQMQYCLLKMLEYCNEELLRNEELSSTLDELAYESQRLLAHEHAWVRCNAAKIIAQIIAHYDFELVGRKLSKTKINTEKSVTNGTATNLDYIYAQPAHDIKSLVLDLCAQIVPGETPQPMIDEIVKIFLYIANMLRDVPMLVKKEAAVKKVEGLEEIEEQESTTKINLYWLLRNIRFLINKEVSKAPHCISVRSALFTLFEGFITLFGIETLEQLAPSILAPLVREMSEEDQNVDPELRQQALRVGSRLRKRLGADVYDKLRTSVQMKLMIRRADRKKVIAQEKIHDPVRAAKRKASMQERKKATKKLKASVMRGKAVDVKQKLRKRKRKLEDDLF